MTWLIQNFGTMTHGSGYSDHRRAEQMMVVPVASLFSLLAGHVPINKHYHDHQNHFASHTIRHFIIEVGRRFCHKQCACVCSTGIS